MVARGLTCRVGERLEERELSNVQCDRREFNQRKRAFRILHACDRDVCDGIVVEIEPERGIGIAYVLGERAERRALLARATRGSPWTMRTLRG